MRGVRISCLGLAFLLAFPPAAGAQQPTGTAEALHALNRLGFGPAPGDVERVSRMGVDRYIDQQLHPETIPLPASLTQDMAQFESLRESPLQLYLTSRQQQQAKKADKDDPAAKKAVTAQRAEPLREARDALIMQAVESPRQLQEALVDFWYNHFNVYGHKDIDQIFVGQYEEQVIRPYVLGHFRDMLEATARSPAMLYYLDEWKNVAPREKTSKQGQAQDEGINENYAREVMELHTLGVNGGYTQADVTQLAHILTGWGYGAAKAAAQAKPQQRGFFSRLIQPVPAAARPDPTLQDAQNHAMFYFNPDHHDFGTKVFLGRQFKGTGQAEAEEALDMLAYSPVTAHHLSYELAQYFVADEPPASLVAKMTQRWLDTKGDLREVMRTMLKSSEFWDPKYRGAKYRTPFQYVVAAVRASGAPVDAEALAGMLTKMGMEPFGCLTPDGYKNTQDAWLNPDGTAQRLTFATALGSGKLSQVHVTHEPDGSVQKTLDNKGAPPLDEAAIEVTYGNAFSAATKTAIAEAAPPLQAALALGSPEMMRR